MSRDPWLRVKDVLAAVLEEPPDRRTALLDRLCAGDTLLRVEVESLLQADATADTFLDKPLFDLEPQSDALECRDGSFLACFYRILAGSCTLASSQKLLVLQQLFICRCKLPWVRRGLGGFQPRF